MNNEENELKKALSYISSNWKMQNNYNDYKSNFIYTANTVEECRQLAKLNNVDEDYVLHRWYNFKTSITCENIFLEFGAIKEKDLKNKLVDLYINDVPFDIKLTVYPNALKHHPYNLRTREGKNQMIQWFYTHQSQQQRKHLANRLFIVCDGKTQFESLSLKSDFEQLRKKIKLYMDITSKEGFNKLVIIDDGKNYSVYSDIIYLN